MHRFPFFKVLSVLAISTGLAACGGNVPILTTPVTAANAYLLTSSNRIIGMDLDDLEYARSVRSVPQATTSTPVDGALDMSEVILDMDYRNSEGALYALTRTGTQGRIIRIDPTTGAMARVSTLVADAADNVGEPALYSALSSSATYTIDFNPVVDRLRVFGSDGSNLRVDVLTGETFTDTNVSPSSSQVNATAYRDDFSPAPGSGRSASLFSLDVVTGNVFATNANGGVLSAGKPLGVSGLTAINGYDINPTNNTGIAVLTSAGTQQVYTINPASAGNAASRLGALPKLPGAEIYKGLTLITPSNPTVTALDNANQLYTFRARTPAEVSSATTAPGVTAGDTLIGLDFRQSDRVLYGLGLSGQVYNLNSATSTASTGMLDATKRYTIDFNPASVINKLRLIGSDLSNAVIDLEMATKDPKPAVSSFETLPPVVAAAAYTNNYRSAASSQLIVIDRANNTLSLQAIAPPTAPATTPVEGALTRLSLLGITLDPTSPVGFDISGRSNDNQLLMARTASSGVFTLYRVNSVATSAPLTAVGPIAGSSNFVDIAIRF